MYYDFASDVWDNELLTHRFQVEVVNEIMHQSWAVDELNAGVEMEEIENLIWRDYPTWAENVLLDAKEKRMLNDE